MLLIRPLQALELDLQQLWGHRAPDEAFIVLFSRTAYTILEQPAALKSVVRLARFSLVLRRAGAVRRRLEMGPGMQVF